MPELPGDRGRTVAAYRAWVQRAGSQEAAFTGEAAWTPERRFARVFERLALPGFGRAQRFELLTGLGAAGRYELSARELAEACGVPLAVLDHALAVWGTPGEHADLAAEVPASIRAGLALR